MSPLPPSPTPSLSSQPSSPTSSGADKPAPEIVVREAQTQADIVAVHAALVMKAKESARAPVNWDKVLHQLVDVMSNPDRYILLIAVEDDRLVGTLCLAKSQFWYSDESFLSDLWLYVLPQHRGGDVLPALLRDARDIADACDVQLFITPNNPSRPRGGRTSVEKVAVTLGYVPSGAVYRFGKEPAADVLRQ